MKTKNEVIEFAKSELGMNNTIVTATLGNGGAGLTLIEDQDEEFISSFATQLDGYYFDGLVDACEDITDSEYYEDDSEVYQFSNDNGFKLQIITF